MHVTHTLCRVKQVGADMCTEISPNITSYVQRINVAHKATLQAYLYSLAGVGQ